jgi:CheY-like chemotaxis protein
MSEQTLHVLLVDDEEGLRKPLKKFLEGNFYYYVDAVASGEEAMQLVERAKKCYHVALIDDLLSPGPNTEPEPHGIELMHRIKENCQETEFIIFTGWGMELIVIWLNH